jgi:nicotinamide mononucleotide transporter
MRLSVSHDGFMSWWEIFAFLAGVASVWLFAAQRVWAWPVGIVNSACWFFLFWSSLRYLDAGLQCVYMGLSLYGWYLWARAERTGGKPRVSRMPRTEGVVLLVASSLGMVGLTEAMVAVGDPAPVAHAATTVVSLMAQCMFARKRLAGWWCWIAVDLAYIGLYANQHLYLTAALQPFFIALCVNGLRRWRVSRRAPDEPPAAQPRVPVGAAS